MPRIHRILSPSYTYHIMLRGNEKRDIFLDRSDRERFIYILTKKKEENGFELYAYCLMDNHVHLIINVLGAEIARIMKCICTSYAIYFNKKYDRVGHLFQDRFRSENITDIGYLTRAIRYIHNNPVKACIVNKAEDFEWSSYTEYLSDMDEKSSVDTSFVLKLFSEDEKKARREFIDFSSNYKDEDEFEDYDIVPEISTIEEAVIFIDEYLSGNRLDRKGLHSLKTYKGTKVQELVNILKNKSNLSNREISKLLGISKSSINNLLGHKIWPEEPSLWPNLEK